MSSNQQTTATKTSSTILTRKPVRRSAAKPATRHTSDQNLQAAVDRASLAQFLRRRIQHKLRVGEVDDPYEREADRVADQVVDGPAPEVNEDSRPGVQRSPFPNITILRSSSVQRETETEVDEEKEEVPLNQTESQLEAEKASLPGTDDSTGDAAAQTPGGSEAGDDGSLGSAEDPTEGPGGTPSAAEQPPLTASTDDASGPPLETSGAGDSQAGATDSPSGGGQNAQDDERDVLQTKSRRTAALTGFDAESREVESGTEGRIHALRGQGRGLPDDARSYFEDRFGADFSAVRIHAGGEASGISRRLGARAFTIGADVFFADGEFQPSTRSGRKLIAHELTHVVQQGGARQRQVANVRSENAKQASVRRKPAAGISRSAPRVRRVLDFLPESLRKKVDEIADGVPGYKLIKFILGFNPVTGKQVPRNAVNFIGALMGMVPGGGILFERLKRARVIQTAFNWLWDRIQKLNITWPFVKTLLEKAASDLSIFNLPSTNLRILKETFGPTARKLLNFGRDVSGKIKEFIFKGFLRLVGGQEGPVFRFLNPVFSVLGKIFDDPVRFGRNLIGAVKLGFMQFMRNFAMHFKRALFGWLFGTFSKAGIDLPTSFDLPSIFHFVAQILQITWQDIRRKIVKRLGRRGEAIMTAVEKSIEIVQILITKGPAGLWEHIKGEVGNIKQMVINEVLAWVRNRIIVLAITKIASLLNPAGAIVQAVLAVYNTIMFFIERWQQIKELVQSVMASLNNIVHGRIGQAANYVEQTMGRALTVMLSFLARFIGLGGIANKVRKVIDKIRKPIHRAIDKVIKRVVKRARLLFKKAKRKVKQGTQSLVQWWKKRKFFKTKNGERHQVFIKNKEKIAVRSKETLLEGLISVNRRDLNKNREELMKQGPPPEKDMRQLVRIEKALNIMERLDARLKEIIRRLKALDAKKKDGPEKKKINRELDRHIARLVKALKIVMAPSEGRGMSDEEAKKIYEATGSARAPRSRGMLEEHDAKIQEFATSRKYVIIFRDSNEAAYKKILKAKKTINKLQSKPEVLKMKTLKLEEEILKGVSTPKGKVGLVAFPPPPGRSDGFLKSVVDGVTDLSNPKQLNENKKLQRIATETQGTGEVNVAQLKQVYEAVKMYLYKKGYRVSKQAPHLVRHKENARTGFFSDYDLHGIYKGGIPGKKEARQVNNRRIEPVFAKILSAAIDPGLVMVQHGAQDNWIYNYKLNVIDPNSTAYEPGGTKGFRGDVRKFRAFYKWRLRKTPENLRAG